MNHPRVANPGCQRECRLDRAAGDFIVEPGCPIHDRPGYTPFKVFWVPSGHPCLVGTLTLVYGDGSAHEHIVCASFLLGLN